MTRIRINGVDEEIGASTVTELLVARGVDATARFVAVAVNGSVIRRSEWPSTVLAVGDNVEIVRPFSGG